MRVLLSGGAKTVNILSAIQPRFKSGVDFAIENNISNISKFLAKGDYFDRAIVMEQSWTEDGTISDETKIRENINKFITIVKGRFKAFEIVFVTAEPEMAKIVLEESIDIMAYSVVILKESPYYASFFTNMITNDINKMPEQLVFTLAKSNEFTDNNTKPEPINWSEEKSTTADTNLSGPLLESANEVTFDAKDMEDEDEDEKDSDFSSQMFSSANNDFEDSIGNDDFQDLPGDDDFNTDDSFDSDFGFSFDDVEDESQDNVDEVFDNVDEQEEQFEDEFTTLDETDGLDSTFDDSFSGFDSAFDSGDITESIDWSTGSSEGFDDGFDTVDNLDDEFEGVGDNSGDNFDDFDTSTDELSGFDTGFDDSFDTESTSDTSGGETYESFKFEDTFNLGGAEDTVKTENYEEETKEENPADLFNTNDGYEAPLEPVKEPTKKPETDIIHQTPYYSGGNNYVENSADDAEETPIDCGPSFKGIKGKGTKGKTRYKAPLNKKDNLKDEELHLIMRTFLKRGSAITITGQRCSGKTLVASNIANIIAKLGYTVLLVDMDTKWRGQAFINKDVYDTVHAEDTSKAALRKAVNSNNNEIGRHVDIIRPGFHILTTGLACDMEPVSEVITAKKLTKFVHNAKNAYNFIIFDVPFEDLTTSLSDLLFATDDIVMCVEATNHGLMEFMLDMCNIENEDIKTTVFGNSQIIFNKVQKVESVFGYKVKTVRQVLKAIDMQVESLIGGEGEMSFRDMKICGVMQFNPLFEKYWFSKHQISDFADGEQIFIDLLRKILIKH